MLVAIGHLGLFLPDKPKLAIYVKYVKFKQEKKGSQIFFVLLL